MKALLLTVVALLLAGCGSSHRTAVLQPRLPRALASSLRAQADAVEAALARGDSCTAQAKAAALQRSVIAAENARRVPAAFRETLGAAVNDLLSSIRCTPPPAPSDEGGD